MSLTIGLPRALLYYKYGVLWETFFHALGCQTVTSPQTNKQILREGLACSIDESCLPSKIFMGHVNALLGKCDYILIPRIKSLCKMGEVCVKFNALYDIARNTFEGARLLDYNVDEPKGDSERRGFIKMGRALGFSHRRAASAYQSACEAIAAHHRLLVAGQTSALLRASGPKILLVSHPYNIYDKLIGQPVSDCITALGGLPVYADRVDAREAIARAKALSPSLYWIYSKELLGAIKLLEGAVDGIILLSAFPCGPDSLTNELVLRRIKSVPVISIIVDELQADAGLQTRIESFMDILRMRAPRSS